MQGFLLFISANLLYLLLGYASSRVAKRLFNSPSSESFVIRRSLIFVAGFATILSLVAVLLLPKKAVLAPLMLPGAYAGLVLSMVLTGNHHGPGDPYSWLVYAAPINFIFYYGIIRVAARCFPSLF